MNDQELVTEARRVGAELRARAGLRAIAGDRDRFAGWLLKELADRLDVLAAGVAEAWAFCRRCKAGTASVPCPGCGGPACAGCGRCPPCDGPAPDEEENHGS